MSITRITQPLLAITLVSAGACSHFHRSSVPTAATQASVEAKGPSRAPVAVPTKTAKKVVGPTDANVAAILLAAGNTDVSYARLAPTRALSQSVKDYADRMVRDNSGINQVVMDLLARIELSPVENAASLEFRDESAAMRDRLRDVRGLAFDSTYMANEVAYHARLLASIDNVLVPSVKNTQLRQFVSNLRPAVQAHLSAAEQVRAGLTSR